MALINILIIIIKEEVGETVEVSTIALQKQADAEVKNMQILYIQVFEIKYPTSKTSYTL